MVLIVFAGVFAGSFMDAIAGGGGLITLPAYLLTGIPAHYALGTNKMSSCLGTMVSTGRYFRNGYVDLKLALPAAAVAVIGAHFGTSLQLRVDEKYLQYLLLAVLPIVAVIVLKTREFPENRLEMPFSRRLTRILVCSGIIGMYDGFYGPGTGTFLLLAYTSLAKLDLRTASGNMKVCNLASNFGALATSLMNGKVFFALGLIGTAASLSGHYLGAGVAMKNGSRIVRPMVLTVLVLLAVKVFSGLFS